VKVKKILSSVSNCWQLWRFLVIFKNKNWRFFLKQGICYRIFFSQKENLAKWRKSHHQKNHCTGYFWWAL
jgi:hypothetical protein